MIKLILETSGITHKSEGETVAEAIEKMGLEWHDIKAKGVFKLSRGKAKAEKLFYLKELKRIFANKLTRTMWAKRLEYLLKT